MNTEIRYGLTLTGNPKYSVWDGRDLIGYTNTKGVVEFDVTAKKLKEPNPVESVNYGYREANPGHLFTNQ